MIRQSVDVIRGYFIWTLLKLEKGINYKKFVLVLTAENSRVDEYALKFLDNAVERKGAEEALVIILDEKMEKKVLQFKYKHTVKTKILSQKNIEFLYKLYCFYNFFDNLAFTFIRTNSDNLLECYLKETDIDEKDIVCLALYKLRSIPEKE